MQHFSSGGPGGQNQNKRSTGARVIHHPSGARGESREERSQLQNKKAAWFRMLETPKFKLWMALETCRAAALIAEAQRLQVPEEELRIEVRQGGRWVQVTQDQLM